MRRSKGREQDIESNLVLLVENKFMLGALIQRRMKHKKKERKYHWIALDV